MPPRKQVAKEHLQVGTIENWQQIDLRMTWHVVYNKLNIKVKMTTH